MANQIGDVHKAIASFQEAVKLDPKCASAHASLGWGYHKTDQLHLAISSYREAVRLYPTDARTYDNLGVALKQSGDPVGAAESLERAVAITRSTARIWRNLASAYAEQPDFAKAIEACRQALAIEPDHVPTLRFLGYTLSLAGEHTLAREQLERALALDPRNALTHYSLGNVLARAGDFEGALREYERAIQLDPGLINAKTSMAIVHAQLGRDADVSALSVLGGIVVPALTFLLLAQPTMGPQQRLRLFVVVCLPPWLMAGAYRYFDPSDFSGHLLVYTGAGLIAFLIVPMIELQVSVRSLMRLLAHEVRGNALMAYIGVATWCAFVMVIVHLTALTYEVSLSTLPERWLGLGALAFPSLCIIGPAMEEAYFRGMLWELFPHGWNRSLKVLLSALVFAGTHGAIGHDMKQVSGVFLIGCLYGLVRSSEGLPAAMLCHGVSNLGIMSMRLIEATP